MQGIIIRQYSDGTALVQLTSDTSCLIDTCASEAECHDQLEANPLQMFSFLDRNKPRVVRASNPVGAKPGQRCDLQWHRDKERLKGAVWLFLVPGILFLVGLILGGLFAKQYALVSDAKIGLELLTGVILMAFGFFMAKCFGPQRRGILLTIRNVTTPTLEERQQWLQLFLQKQSPTFVQSSTNKTNKLF